jgi:hypothetical protein
MQLKKIWEKKGIVGTEEVGGGVSKSGKGATKGLKHAGKGMLRGGAGVGAAALGIGAGIGAAALGIAELAKAMKDLDKTQIWALPATVLGIAAAFWALSPAIVAIGTSATVSSTGLLALGGAIALVGGGIGVAAWGIGQMAQGIATLGDPKVAKNLTVTAEGVAKLMGAFSSGFWGGITDLIAGAGKFYTLSEGIGALASNAAGMRDIGYGFEKIQAVMDGDASKLTKLKETLQAIAEVDANNNSAINKLANICSMFYYFIPNNFTIEF